MPRHRSLTLRKLVNAVGWELMERYFTEKFPEAKLASHIIMDYEAVEAFMEDPRNAEARGLMQEDFRRINDVCGKGKNLLVRAYNYFDIPRDDKRTLENLAMKLFLDHKAAFDYAYAWYSYYHASGKMSHHSIPGEFGVTDEKLECFLEETKERFRELAW